MIKEEVAGIFMLLDFLMGYSISDTARRHGFDSSDDVERIIRFVLLRHGYQIEENESA